LAAAVADETFTRNAKLLFILLGRLQLLLFLLNSNDHPQKKVIEVVKVTKKKKAKIFGIKLKKKAKIILTSWSVTCAGESSAALSVVPLMNYFLSSEPLRNNTKHGFLFLSV